MSLPVFSHFLGLPTIKLSPLDADSWIPEWVGSCTFQDPLGLSNELSCEAGSLSCCRLNPHRCFQSVILKLYFPELELWVARSVSLPLVPRSLSTSECGTAGSTSHCLTGSASHCLATCPLHWLPVSTPPTSLDEWVFFNFLVVGFPYSLIFCQFGVFLSLNCCCPFFGCVRRHSVSTYASILARSLKQKVLSLFQIANQHYLPEICNLEGYNKTKTLSLNSTEVKECL